MKSIFRELLNNELFLILFNGVIAYTAMTAVIIIILQIPNEAILDSGLKEILMVFEEFPDSPDPD